MSYNAAWKWTCCDNKSEQLWEIHFIQAEIKQSAESHLKLHRCFLAPGSTPQRVTCSHLTENEYGQRHTADCLGIRPARKCVTFKTKKWPVWLFLVGHVIACSHNTRVKTKNKQQFKQKQSLVVTATVAGLTSLWTCDIISRVNHKIL